jgi:hypothetical protein
MSIETPSGIAVVQTPSSGRDASSYVDWPAIFAGIVFASAISLVLISFGSSIGLNFVVPLGADLQLHGGRLSHRAPASSQFRRH